MKIIFETNDTIDQTIVSVTSESGFCYFKGAVKELAEIIAESYNLAEALRADIEAGNIEDSSEMDYELYENYSKNFN